MDELDTLRNQRDALDDQIQRMEWALAHGSSSCMSTDSFATVSAGGDQAKTPAVSSANGASVQSEPSGEASSDSSSSSSSSDEDDPEELAKYKEAIENYKRQRDEVSINETHCAGIVILDLCKASRTRSWQHIEAGNVLRSR